MPKAAYVFDEDVDFYNDERVKFFGIHASNEGKIVTFGGGVPLKRTPLAAPLFQPENERRPDCLHVRGTGLRSSCS